jgi:lipopolysaccharide/colanic/teichoic acid biosynthesis glycosyltransferase
MVKRILDLLVAIVGLLLLSPIFLIVGIWIKLDSPGSVFYRGDRIGRNGSPFKIYKFRTMVVNADRMGSALTHSGDPRVTRIGRILRQWKIDELPQLINVVLGEMSIVGPRPESPHYVEHYSPKQRQVLRVKPGITGLTQVNYRHEETLLSQYMNREAAYVELIMPEKLALDLEYIANQSLFLDLKLIVQTFLCLFESDERTDRQYTGEGV